MACRYTFQGKTYEAHEFDDVLRAMSPSEASKYMTGVQSIPDAPLIDKTDKWLTLSLKRIVKMAVDGGYDKVAFVNGEQSAERYDLSKHIKSITATKTFQDKYAIRAIGFDNQVVVEDVYNAEKLPDVVGKDIADKIVRDATDQVDSTGRRKAARYEGLDLKVGGEGMKTFYDAIVPNATKALLKKLGGGQMELSVLGQQNSVEDINEFLGRWKASSEALDAVVNNGVISARKHDQVAKAIVQAIPVNVVDMLASNGIDAKNFARNPKMYFDHLPSDVRLAVSNGLARSLSLVGARIRTGLRSAYKAGLDKEVLATLKASDLSLDESVRIFSFLEGNQLAGIENPASVGASSGAVDGSRSSAFGDGKSSPAALADFVRWTHEISPHRVGDSSILAQNSFTITPAMQDKAAGGLPMFSRSAAINDLTRKATDAVAAFADTPGKLNWWHKTVGTQYNLARRSPHYKRVFDAVQDFIGDVSYYATEAADLAPSLLPKLETWRDIVKAPVSGADTKAIAAPIFEGTLIWARDESGKPVKLEKLEADAKLMSADKKAQRLLRNDKISEGVLKMWRGLPLDQYESLIDGKYEKEMLKAGVLWSDAELHSMFSLSDGQVGLYKEFRKATDKSLTNLAISDMLFLAGKDADPIRDAVLEAKDVDEAALTLRDYLMSLTEMDPASSDRLLKTANMMVEKADRANDLMDRGYAPLSRFGAYTLDVVDANGERVYFGMFESRLGAAKMSRQMAEAYPGARITQGTQSQEAYKLFAGVSPETVELFGDMMGLEDNAAYQQYLKMAKSTRSAMKRLIERKGIAGFSEDAGRVLAGFVYSNARQTSQNLHTGEMGEAANAIPQQQGELKDHAVKLVDYIKNPQEEAQQIRGLLFAQYIGGSVASAMVNMTQPLTMTIPWLSQFGGIQKASRQMGNAIRDMSKKSTGDAKLDAALKKAEEDGTVSPQEVHDLMRQSQGKGALQAGDGTLAGEAKARGQNALSRIGFAWGKLFSAAEQFNRRSTYIAAYRTAVEQGMTDPDGFARRAIHETQGVYNKGNKPKWARGAVGGTIFTFKQYGISYIEMLGRMASAGEPGSAERAAGRRSALYALAILMMLSGAGGLPGADDLDDLISGLMQSMGYNFDSKARRKAFLAEYLGEGAAEFLDRGVSGIAGVPIDVSGRLGLGNMIPATGLFTNKRDHTRDVLEIAGPAGDLFKRGFDAAGKAIKGDVFGLRGAVATIAPKAVQNTFQSADMMDKGMYRDQSGKKVIETDAMDALFKAIGFQPNVVKDIQDRTSEQFRASELNKLRESAIADKWARGVFEKDNDLIQRARDDLAQWNADNPESPIRINFQQIRQRVQAMNMSKSERIIKAAPKELRQQAREALAVR